MPECLSNPGQGKQFDADFFMMINLIRDDPKWLCPRLKLLEQSRYWDKRIFNMNDLNDFGKKLESRNGLPVIEYNTEAEKALLLVSG